MALQMKRTVSPISASVSDMCFVKDGLYITAMSSSLLQNEYATVQRNFVASFTENPKNSQQRLAQHSTSKRELTN